MAKGKHSPALFEVVHGKKHVDKSTRTGALRTPNWWFKGRQRITEAGLMSPPPADEAAADDDDTPPAFSPDDPTANASAMTLRGREERERALREHREPAVTSAVTSDTPAPATETQPARSVVGEGDPVPETMAIPEELTAPSPRRHAPVQVVMDRDRHEMYVRVRYTTAIVAGFSLLVLVALSYLSGRHTGRGPASASTSPSAEEIAAGPVEKGVAEFSPRAGPSVTSTPAAVPAAGITPAAAFTSSQRPSAPRPTTGVAATPSPAPGVSTQPRPPEPAAPPKNVTRTLNLQYVIVQGYPPEEKQMALEACQYLNAAHIPSTVETGVIGPWNGSWYYVVGVRPFERASGPEYNAYVAAIEEVSNKFAGKSRFKRFTPTGTRWRGTRAG